MARSLVAFFACIYFAGLRHAALSTWLNAGVPPTQVAEWTGHSVQVLLRTYAKCIVGQDAIARRRIEEAMRDDEEDPGQ